MNEALKFIRIIEPFGGTFNENLNGVKFEAGISVEPQPEAVCERIGAIWRVQLYNKAGEIRQTRTSAMSMASSRDALMEANARVIAQAAPDLVSLPPSPDGRPSELAQITREQLEDLADDEGIAGVRKVAEQFGIKSKSVVVLIDGIVAKVEEMQKAKDAV